jgi:hypothetical protein
VISGSSMVNFSDLEFTHQRLQFFRQTGRFFSIQIHLAAGGGYFLNFFNTTASSWRRRNQLDPPVINDKFLFLKKPYTGSIVYQDESLGIGILPSGGSQVASSQMASLNTRSQPFNVWVNAEGIRRTEPANARMVRWTCSSQLVSPESRLS